MKQAAVAMLVAGCTLLAPPTAAGQGPPSSDVLRQRVGPQWSVLRTESVGADLVVREVVRPYPETPTEGRPRVDTDAQAEQIATSFLSSYADLFFAPLGLSSDASEVLTVESVIPTANKGEFASRGTDFTVIFSQRYGDVSVFESSLAVSLTQTGEVWSVVNKLARIDAGTPTSPTLSTGDALVQARQVLGDDSALPDAEARLWLFPPNNLAYRLNFLAPHFREILVDAVTGKLLLQRTNVRDHYSKH